jgi:hypothetical protein
MNIIRTILGALFGAAGQVIVGVVTLIAGAATWVYFILTPPTISAVFHISMFFGCVACYAIIATGLGYRATERVEQKVEADIDVDVDIEEK